MMVSETKSSDIMAYLKTHLEDEIKGANEYCDKSKEMEAADMECMAKGFYMMAWDEYTHAKFLIGEIMKAGGSLSKEHEEAWYALNKRMEDSFRD